MQGKDTSLLLSQAVEASFQYNHEKALELVNAALAASPGTPELVVERAEILCELGRHKEAAEYLLGATKSDVSGRVAEELRKIEQELKYEEIATKGGEELKVLERLLSWGRHNGVDLSKIKLVNYSKDFRGIHAAKRIRKGEHIFAIPEKMLVHLDAINRTCVLAKQVADAKLDLDFPVHVAIVCLVHEAKNNPTSPWKEYAESFPVDADTFPCFFTKEEQEYLKGTMLEEWIREDLESTNKVYATLCAAVPEFAKISAAEFHKTMTLVLSRCFDVKSLNGKYLGVPIVDMCNYYVKLEEQTVWEYDEIKKEFHLTAMRDIKRDEYINVNYGRKPNSKFLLHYGFVPEDNLTYTIMVQPALDPKDPLLPAKRKLICFEEDEDLDLRERRYKANYCDAPYRNGKVLSDLRFVTYADADVAVLEKYINQAAEPNVRFKKIRIPALSVAHETKTLLLFEELIKAKLARFPQPVDKDEAILKSKTGLTINAQNALTVRIEDHRAYLQVLRFIDRALALLRTPRAEAETEIAKMAADDPDKEYFETSVLKLLASQVSP